MGSTSRDRRSKSDKNWPDVVSEILEYVPVVIVLLLITNKWDGEWIVLASLFAGKRGAQFLTNLRKAKDESNGSLNCFDDGGESGERG